MKVAADLLASAVEPGEQATPRRRPLVGGAERTLFDTDPHEGVGGVDADRRGESGELVGSARREAFGAAALVRREPRGALLHLDRPQRVLRGNDAEPEGRVVGGRRAGGRSFTGSVGVQLGVEQGVHAVPLVAVAVHEHHQCVERVGEPFAVGVGGDRRSSVVPHMAKPLDLVVGQHAEGPAELTDGRFDRFG